MSPTSASPSRARALACRACGAEYALERRFFCEACLGPLQVAYNLDRPEGAWTIGELMPFGRRPLTQPTPWVAVPHLARELGIVRLWIKDEGASFPSRSFKDRVVVPAAEAARAFGLPVLAAASTGNLAVALASICASEGMGCVIFVPAALNETRKAAIETLGAVLVEVEGDYDAANRLVTELVGEIAWGFANADLKPYYLEGARGVLFEIAQAHPEPRPDHLVLPLGGGGLMAMTAKALSEWNRLTGSDWRPRLHGAQAAGCAPVVDAWRTGRDRIRPVKPDTLAHSIAVGDPGDGMDALEAIRASGGRAIAVAEGEILPAARRLARLEGIATEAAGGVALGAVEALRREGAVGSDESVGVVLTASGGEFPWLADAALFPKGRARVSGDCRAFMKETLPHVQALLAASRRRP